MVYTWGAAGLVSERRSPGQAGATSLWYHFGPQGETRYLTYPNGQRTNPFIYTAFGVPVLSGASVTAIPFQYGGQVGYFTSPSGLILCGSRWYDPKLGRWLSRDPIGYAGGPNLFEYCASNPIGGVDPSGLDVGGTVWGPNGPHYSVPQFHNHTVANMLGAVGGFLGRTFTAFWRSTPVNEALVLLGQRPAENQNQLIGQQNFFVASLALGARGGGGGLGCGLGEAGAAGAIGDLTANEGALIQELTNQAGRPIHVVGSAASGTRRGIGSNLPFGKGSGTRSDIDYIIPHSSADYWSDHFHLLPGLDPKHGPIGGNPNPFMGPFITFTPR